LILRAVANPTIPPPMTIISCCIPLFMVKIRYKDNQKALQDVWNLTGLFVFLLKLLS
jgi:hypothetical protein